MSYMKMTNMWTLQETIRPSADLRNHYSEMSKLCKENKEVVIITVNGRGDTVTLSYEEYKNMKARIGIRKIVLYIAQNFGNTIALEKLDEIEKRILELGGDPYIGTEPRYLILKRQGYKVLILEKDLVFYKIDEENKQVIVYAVVDQHQDYLNIIRGL